MRAVVQRVTRASVTVEGRVSGSIDAGLAVLLGVDRGDGVADAEQIAAKIAHLRIFTDEAGMMNRSVLETSARVLLVSQFTLYGDARKGRRPSFINAAREEQARPLYESVAASLNAQGITVERGVFGAHMLFELVNDGPVTILLDSKKQF